MKPHKPHPPPLPSDALILIFAVQPSIPSLLSSRLVSRFWNQAQLQNDALIWKRRVLDLLPDPAAFLKLEEEEGKEVGGWWMEFARRYEGGKWKALFRLWDAYERRLGVLVGGLSDDAILRAMQPMQPMPGRGAHFSNDEAGREEERHPARSRNIIGAWVRNGTKSALVQARRIGNSLFVTRPFGKWRERIGVVDLMPSDSSQWPDQNPVVMVSLDSAPPGIDPAAADLEEFEVQITGVTSHIHTPLPSPPHSFICLSEYNYTNTGTDFRLNSIWSLNTTATGAKPELELRARFPKLFMFQCVGFYEDLVVALVPPGIVKAWRVRDVVEMGGVEGVEGVWERRIDVGKPIDLNFSSLFFSDAYVAACVFDYHEDENIFLFKAATGEPLGWIPNSAWAVLPSSTSASTDTTGMPRERPPRILTWSLKPFVHITPFHILLAVDIFGAYSPICTCLITIDRKGLALQQPPFDAALQGHGQQHELVSNPIASRCISLPWTQGIGLDNPMSEREYVVGRDGFGWCFAVGPGECHGARLGKERRDWAGVVGVDLWSGRYGVWGSGSEGQEREEEKQEARRRREERAAMGVESVWVMYEDFDRGKGLGCEAVERELGVFWRRLH